MNWLFEADRDLFNLINNHWDNRVFDVVMVFVRNANFWLPLYLFVLIFALLNLPRSGWFILMAITTVVLTDLLSSHLIKNYIFRLRPCNDLSLSGIRVLAAYCPQSSSFTSSHAANHFGLAAFMSSTLYPFAKRWIYLTYLWAFLIIYAQVYVGVHFPVDVFAGALVGIMAGRLTAWIYQKQWGNPNLENQEL